MIPKIVLDIVDIESRINMITDFLGFCRKSRQTTPLFIFLVQYYAYDNGVISRFFILNYVFIMRNEIVNFLF
jgi:hypothetical protein